MILARRIANDLDAAGAAALVKFEACWIKEDARAHVDLLFKNRSRVATAGKIQLDVAEVIELRCFITKYLNLLEAIMLAWHHDSADREMLASEFRYFVLGSGDMKEVRAAFDRADEVDIDPTRAAYPAISAFIAYMSKRP